MKKNLLSIGEIAKISGVHVKSLRYYDRIGVLKPVYIDPDTSYRYYSASQLGIVEAIRTCVELDIPLKEFSNYSEGGGQTIHYARLLEHGKRLAEKKIRSIRGGLRVIAEMRQEIDRNERFSRMEQPVVYDAPAKRYLVEPLDRAADGGGYDPTAIGGLYLRATDYGCKPGYEYGRLYVYRRDGVERYQFIDILSPAGKNVSGVMRCPAGRCYVRHFAESRIETAREVFPEPFAEKKVLLVTESELFTGDYHIERPQYQMKCVLMK